MSLLSTAEQRGEVETCGAHAHKRKLKGNDVVPEPLPPTDIAPKYKVGEPSPGFDIHESVAYSHNWFSRIEVDGESCGLCLLCDEEEKAAKASGKPLPKCKKKKSKVLKTPCSTTKRKCMS